MTGLTYTATASITSATSKAGGVVLTGTGLLFDAGTSPITQAFAQAKGGPMPALTAFC